MQQKNLRPLTSFNISDYQTALQNAFKTTIVKRLSKNSW